MTTDDRGDDRGSDRGGGPDAWLGLSGQNRGDGAFDGAGWYRDLRNAAIILTGWPLGRRGEIGPATEAKSRRAFVLVGLALGLAAALFGWIADGLGLQLFGAAVFATVAVVILTNARAECGAAATAAELAETEPGSDRRFALIAGCVGAILLARIAGLSAIASLADMLGALIAAQVLSAAVMALATLSETAGTGKADDSNPPFDPQRDKGDSTALSIVTNAVALLLAILFVGFLNGLLAYAAAMLVGALVWFSAEICGMPRDRNFLYTIRIKTELAVIVTVAAIL